jgi:hypothetical protein
LSPRTTSTPASAALEALTNPLHSPSRFEDAEIDLPSFGRLYEFCENQRIDYAGTNASVKLRCDGAVTAAKKKTDLLKEIFSDCEAGIHLNEFGLLSAYFDAPQTTPAALINPQRMISMSVTKDLSRKADGYKIDYINGDNNLFAEDSFTVLRDVSLNGDSVERAFSQVQFVFITQYATQYAHAAWLARRPQAKEALRPSTMKISVGKDGRLYRPGGLVKVQRERLKIGVGSSEVSGFIIENNKIADVRTLERFDLIAGRDYAIVSESESRVVTKSIAGQGEYTNLLRFKQGFELQLNSPDSPDAGMIVSASQSGSKLCLIDGGASETADGYEFALVDCSPVVYPGVRLDARSVSD